MTIKTIVKQLLTESDNVTHDLYRYLAIASIITGLALQVYSIVDRDQVFDMQTFGIGIGTLFAGVGIALSLKKETKSDNP